MLEKLFGNVLIEKILFYLLVNQSSYATELHKIFNMPLYSIQRALARLELGGILVRKEQGKTQVYQFNPSYHLLPELKLFLQKAYDALPSVHKTTYYEPIIRKRPRRAGKPTIRENS